MKLGALHASIITTTAPASQERVISMVLVIFNFTLFAVSALQDTCRKRAEAFPHILFDLVGGDNDFGVIIRRAPSGMGLDFYRDPAHWMLVRPSAHRGFW